MYYIQMHIHCGKSNNPHNAIKERQTHEESQSGLTISVSSPVVNALQSARSVIRTAQTRDNKTCSLWNSLKAGKP